MHVAAPITGRRCRSSASSSSSSSSSANAAAASALRQSLLRRRPRAASAAAASSDAAAAADPAAAEAAAAPRPPRIEFPPSTVVSKADGYDLRLYQPYPVVRTEYEARPPAFLSLGEYLGGANAANARFARPEPAIMRQGLPGGKKTMELFIGSKRSGGEGESDGPPAPIDSALTLDVSGGELVAVGVFGGNLTREAAEGAHAALRGALKRDGLEAADAQGVYRACQYGAIHSLGERRNEIWVRVKL